MLTDALDDSSKLTNRGNTDTAPHTHIPAVAIQKRQSMRHSVAIGPDLNQHVLDIIEPDVSRLLRYSFTHSSYAASCTHCVYSAAPSLALHRCIEMRSPVAARCEPTKLRCSAS
eukprot:6148620-Pleurochrysis_carterae.AAC.2